MQVVFVVLHKTELLQNLLTSLKKAGVSGGTILDSQGMISYIQESDESYILGSLRLFLEQARPDSKTMFFIINDEQTDLVFDTIAAEKIFTATGGVIVPITLDIDTIIPKWIAFTPRPAAIGHKTGTSNTQVAIPSKNVPNNKSITAIMKQKSGFERCKPTIALTSSVEIPENVKSHENAVEVAIINNIIALPFPESRIIAAKSFIFISLYTNTPTINE